MLSGWWTECRWAMSASVLGLALSSSCGTDDAPLTSSLDAALDAAVEATPAIDSANGCVADEVPVDAGDPPSHCVAPCVWDLMKRCLPRGSCTRQEYPNLFPWPASVMCAPENDWWEIYMPANAGERHDYYLGNCLCHSFNAVSLSSAGNRAVVTRWTDGTGRLVGLGDGYPAGKVVCGPFSSLRNFSEFKLPDGSLVRGFTEYDVDPTQPDCAPWLGPACETGTCPGTPPKTPFATAN